MRTASARLSGLALTLLLATLASGCAGGHERRAVPRIDFSEFLVIQAPLEEASMLDFGAHTPGSAVYKGGTLPEPIPAKPMYCFRADFTLPESARGHDVSLYTGLWEYPFRLYLNGHELVSRGRYREGSYTSNMRSAAAFHLPSTILAFGGDNTIIIEIYPNFERTGLDSIWLAEADAVDAAVFWRNLVNIDIVQVSCILAIVMGVYTLLLYLMEKRRRPELGIYALLCLSFALAYQNVAFFHEAIPEARLEALSKAGILLSMALLLAFIAEKTALFESTRVRGTLTTAVIVFGIVLSSAVFMQSTKQSVYLVFGIMMRMAIVPMLIASALILAWSVFLKRQLRSIPLFVGFLGLLAFAAHDIKFYAGPVHPYAWFAPHGFFICMLSILVTILGDQVALYRNSLRQTDELASCRKEIERLTEEVQVQREALERFVPGRFLELLGKDSALDVRLGDSTVRIMTALHANVSRSDPATATGDRTLTLMNNYLYRMEQAVQKSGGFVDKYIGDAFLSLFPGDEALVGWKTTKSADSALAAALELSRLIDEFNLYLQHHQEHPMDIRIGINTGETVLGAVGSKTRMETTAFGDTVSLAGRLESLCRHYRVRTLFTEFTQETITNNGAFAYRIIDCISVSGNARSIRLYELLDLGLERDRQKMDTMEPFGRAQELYRDRRFSESMALFQELVAKNPNDHVPLLFLERCAEFLNTPPSDEWDGVFRLHPS